MTGIDPSDAAAALEHIKALAASRAYVESIHVAGRLARHGITLAEIWEALARAVLLENYPHFYKGPCALVYGDTAAGRPIHVVCSTTLPALVLLTTYEPTLPKWKSPTERS